MTYDLSNKENERAKFIENTEIIGEAAPPKLEKRGLSLFLKKTDFDNLNLICEKTMISKQRLFESVFVPWIDQKLTDLNK